MSCVRSEKIYDLRPLRSRTSSIDFPKPGDEVMWKHDSGIGLVVSRDGEDCIVLWAKDYDLDYVFTTVSINAKSTKLNATWSAEIADDLNAMYGIDTSQEVKC